MSENHKDGIECDHKDGHCSDCHDNWPCSIRCTVHVEAWEE